jgi:uncharacterized protein
MIRLSLWKLISIAVLTSTAILAPAHGESLKDSTPNISVTGFAYEEVVPDLTTVSLAVISERATAIEAQDETAKSAQAVLAELTANGVAASDIHTQRVTLSQITREERDARGVVKRNVKLYRAREEIAATLRGAGKAGKILAALVDKGANEILDVNFGVSDVEHRLEALRKKAIVDARARAHAYVEAIELKLARVLEIRPGEEDAPQQQMTLASHALRAAAPAAASVAEIPLNPGAQRLMVSVIVTFALAR